MNIEITEKLSFALLGKESQGLSAKGFEWVPEIWKEAMPNLDQIREFEVLDKNNETKGLWGAMSDVEDKFLKWDEHGKYLVGIEVKSDVVAPSGWSKWVIPSFKYIKVLCSQTEYGEVMHKVIKEYMPSKGYTLLGAIQEFYSPSNKEGELYLYFPIERL